MLKTIKECSVMTGLPYSFIRNLCLQEKVRFVRSGRKYYVLVESLLSYCKGVIVD